MRENLVTRKTDLRGCKRIVLSEFHSDFQSMILPPAVEPPWESELINFHKTPLKRQPKAQKSRAGEDGWWKVLDPVVRWFLGATVSAVSLALMPNWLQI